MFSTKIARPSLTYALLRLYEAETQPPFQGDAHGNSQRGERCPAWKPEGSLHDRGSDAPNIRPFFYNRNGQIARLFAVMYVLRRLKMGLPIV